MLEKGPVAQVRVLKLSFVGQKFFPVCACTVQS